jgi:polyisoprenoid-binding protein YceI
MKRYGLWITVLAAALILGACAAPTATVTPAPAVDDPAVSGPAQEAEPAQPAADPTEEPAAEGEDTGAAPAGGEQVFVIVPAESEVRFVIDEVLNGSPKTVVGVTSGVSGEIAVDFADTSTAQVRALSVDLTGLETDNGFRNRALHDAILQTGRAEFATATFVQTGISGLPQSVTVGQTYTFQITGDMTIHGVTKPLTFNATVTPVSETRLEGTASVSVLYADFDVRILRLPAQVASVEDTISLEIDFVAVAGG